MEEKKASTVICVCGFVHRLSKERNCDRLQIVCHSCYRTLMWKDGIPIARRPILISGRFGNSDFEETVLKIVSEGDD